MVSDGLVGVTISRNRLCAYLSAPAHVEKLESDAIYQALNTAGVIIGIKEEVVLAFADNPRRERVLVAEGIPPQHGVDEYVELLFENKMIEDEVAGDARVDFREINAIVSVDAGTVLAVKNPSRPGIDGKDVTGKKIPPPAPRRIELRAGKGVEIQDEGKKAVALDNGRPCVKKTGAVCFIQIEHVLIYDQDINIKSGNIRYKGDVKILGNVSEAMEVTASGDIEVMGLVTRAKITGGGKVIIRKSVIHSNIKAGLHLPGAKKISFLLQDLKKNLELLNGALELFKVKKASLEEADFGRVVMTLLDTRFRNIGHLVRETIQSITGVQDVQPPEELVQCAKSLSCLIGLNPLTITSFNDLISDVSTGLELLRQQKADSSDVLVYSAMMSNIQSSGRVFVTSMGCVNTTIYAERDVIIKGAFKGGSIFCEGNIEVQELGSMLGAPPVVRAGAKKYVDVGKAYPGVIIQLGQSRVVIREETVSFKTVLNNEGEVDIFKNTK